MKLNDWLAAMRMPSRHKGEGDDDYTDRVHREGAARGVYRQCSIGWHDECSDPDGCRCACHTDAAPSYGHLAHWLAVCMEERDALEDLVLDLNANDWIDANRERIHRMQAQIRHDRAAAMQGRN